MFKKLIIRLKRYFSHESCYTKREQEGTATMGCCSGLWGGDYYTNYLQYSCVGCWHYVDVANNKHH